MKQSRKREKREREREGLFDTLMSQVIDSGFLLHFSSEFDWFVEILIAGSKRKIFFSDSLAGDWIWLRSILFPFFP